MDFSAIDIDWFFIDDAKNVCHVASGMGTPPLSISKNYESYVEVTCFFLNLDEISPQVHINEELDLYVNMRTITNSEQYFKSYINYSRKGIISFDKTIVSDPDDGSYHLVCYPGTKLSYKNLPDNIQQILDRTVLKGVFFPFNGFNINQFG